MVANSRQALRILTAGLLLVPAAGQAQEETALQSPREFVRRALFLSGAPGVRMAEVYVAGEAATVLRFQRVCDPARTKLASGWEGLFEPLMVLGGTVVLIPLRDIPPQDRVPLMVTFLDGTVAPFIVRTRHDQADHQVTIIQDVETPQALHWALADALRQKSAMGVEIERHRREALSADHALAGLLASGAEDQTPFFEVKSGWLNDRWTKTHFRLFRGKGKAAVVFKITNKGQTDWKLLKASLSPDSPDSESRPFALRMNGGAITPGTTGTIAVVVDRNSFLVSNRPVSLNLTLICHGNATEISIKMEHQLASPMKARLKL